MAVGADEYYVNGVRVRGTAGTVGGQAGDDGVAPAPLRTDVEGMRGQGERWGFTGEELRALRVADALRARGESPSPEGQALQRRRAERERALGDVLEDREDGNEGRRRGRGEIGAALRRAEGAYAAAGAVRQGEPAWEELYGGARAGRAGPDTAGPDTAGPDAEEVRRAERVAEYTDTVRARARDAADTQVDRLLTLDTGRTRAERGEDRMGLVRQVVEPVRGIADAELRLAEAGRVTAWRREQLAEAQRELAAAQAALARGGGEDAGERTRIERARERVATEAYVLEELAYVRGEARSAVAEQAARRAMARGARRADAAVGTPAERTRDVPAMGMAALGTGGEGRGERAPRLASGTREAGMRR